ncbi:MAG TPA: glutamate synthase subunit beta [Acidimicrobiales bacterium]|nr:glutamate synthase subunit beta [Acidimicrobiales bacterium]
MGKPTGFTEFQRHDPQDRDPALRVLDWNEFHEHQSPEELREQGARCMDCGVPFCHTGDLMANMASGCPINNLIPEWNDLVYRDHWRDALDRLHKTNNFPEFTGRVCPAPCEGSCVLGINADPVTIERIEYEIAERAFADGTVVPLRAETPTGKSVAVVGSGPSGLACAQQLARAGHSVVVFERAERPGGLLRYGIPEFKMEKAVLDRRLAQLETEGVTLRCATAVGVDPAGTAGANGTAPEPGQRRGLGTANAPDVTAVSAKELLEQFDALVLAGGATLPRDLAVPGRELRGVHSAMEYLKPSNLVREGAWETSPISAEGKHVVIIGGGDTGADCLGTAHRQGAASVHQLEILPRPPDARPGDNPWPTWPLVFRTSSAHEEGGERLYAVTTTTLVDDGTGAVAALRGHQVTTAVVDGRPTMEPVPGTEFEIPCELVLLARGFLGAERRGGVAEHGLALDARGNVACDDNWQTSRERVFVCGDMTRGQSLIVWAIAEGRSCAAGVDRALMGETALPAPLVPGQPALR